MTKWCENLTNRLSEGGEIQHPRVGMGVTEYLYSDRHAYTIVEVSKSGKTIWITHDDYKFKDGYGIDYKSNPDGPRYMARKYNGKWKIVKGNYIAIGLRDAYYDPHY